MASPNHIWAGLNAVFELARKIDIPDYAAVVDSLESQSSTEALSARQGYLLDQRLVALESAIDINDFVLIGTHSKSIDTSNRFLVKSSSHPGVSLGVTVSASYSNYRILYLSCTFNIVLTGSSYFYSHGGISFGTNSYRSYGYGLNIYGVSNLGNNETDISGDRTVTGFLYMDNGIAYSDKTEREEGYRVNSPNTIYAWVRSGLSYDYQYEIYGDIELSIKGLP